MILDRNRGSGLVDPAMLLTMDPASDLILLLGIRDNLLVLQHQLLWFSILSSNKLVVSGSTSQPALLRPISPSRVLGMLEIVSDLVKTLLRHRILTFRPQVSAVNDGIDQLAWIRAQIPAAGNLTDTLETQGIPDTTRRYVILIHQVEH